MQKSLTIGLFLTLAVFPLRSATLESASSLVRLQVNSNHSSPAEIIEIKEGATWVHALSSVHSAIRIVTAGEIDESHVCEIGELKEVANGVVLTGDCGVGTFEQHILLAAVPDALDVIVRFTPREGVRIRSVEDRYNFAPGRRSANKPEAGPVDFVWSQNAKNEADDVIPTWGFKSPVVMLQQGKVLTALIPKLSDRRHESLALDLDVTSDSLPWLSYGAIPSEPYGHSYFRRSRTNGATVLAGDIEYQYTIVAASQPEKLGYRRIARLLWADIGRNELLRSNDLQQNLVHPEIVTFDDWRKDTWVRYANEVYRGFDCDGQRCGTLSSYRNPWGAFDKFAPDAWFNAWFQTLRSAYGWYLYGRNIGETDIEAKAESVLNLALKSPQNDGAFSTIYLVDDKRWIQGDGWAGFPGEYHTFSMSWTGYWMLEWANNLVPARKVEIVAFARRYGDFLVKHQLASGVIPSWYDNNLTPRKEFQDFNAETAASALFLASLAETTGSQVYLDAAKRSMAFITQEVLPRQRWFDFETFLSCARKPFDFYDPWTTQYPQNNMSTIQAASAYLKLFQLTKDPTYLERGKEVLDYLLLTQQVWNNPALSPKLVGGFTTQNTDAEWSDARECYAAVLLWDYYKATGDAEYLERSVAAARSLFAVAPWENWAHTGNIDEPGALTGFHWGPGSGMTSVEIMSPTLGDAFVDLQTKQAVGFNACSIRHLNIEDHAVSFDLDTFPDSRRVTLKFANVDKHGSYRISWNGNHSEVVSAERLARDGYVVVP